MTRMSSAASRWRTMSGTMAHISWLTAFRFSGWLKMIHPSGPSFSSNIFGLAAIRLLSLSELRCIRLAGHRISIDAAILLAPTAKAIASWKLRTFWGSFSEPLSHGRQHRQRGRCSTDEQCIGDSGGHDHLHRSMQVVVRGEHALGDLQIDRRHLVERLDLLQGEVACLIDLDAIWRGLTAEGAHDEDHIDAIAAVRVIAVANAQAPHHLGLHACFLGDLPHHRGFDRLIGFDEAAGHLPVAA